MYLCVCGICISFCFSFQCETQVCRMSFMEMPLYMKSRAKQILERARKTLAEMKQVFLNIPEKELSVHPGQRFQMYIIWNSSP